MAKRKSMPRKKSRNASASKSGKGDKLAMAGGALAGGAASVFVAETLRLTPVASGAATAGLALAGSSVTKNARAKEALVAAATAAGGLIGVQLLGQWYTRQHEAQAAKPSAAPRQADGGGQGFVTRDELNDAVARFTDRSADQHQRTCDLMTALHDEITRVVVAENDPR